MTEPTLYRSGLANTDEFIGYSAAGAALGASLAYVSDIKQPHLLHYLIQSLVEGNRAFLDNGMITEIGRGKFVSVKGVFERYKKIVQMLKPSQAKRLAIVVPDNPFDPAASLQIVRENKSDIKWLAARCDVILPIHKAPDIAAHAKAMMNELNNISRIRLGVPCKKSIKTATGAIEVRLSLQEIESLFELTNQRGRHLFCGVHYLALSEVSRGGLYKERVELANRFDMDISCDACRTAAVMGNEQKSNRAGSVLMRHLKGELTESNTKSSVGFCQYTHDDEWDEPVIHHAACAAIEEDVHQFVAEWNCVMGIAWQLDIDDMQTDEAQDYCKNLLCEFPRIIEDELIEGLKSIYWQLFYYKEHEPTTFDKRTETFARLFGDGDRHCVQLAIAI